jgi:transposase InsO family protein
LPLEEPDYRLRQDFITPYTPEQNGIVERFRAFETEFRGRGILGVAPCASAR